MQISYWLLKYVFNNYKNLFFSNMYRIYLFIRNQCLFSEALLASVFRCLEAILNRSRPEAQLQTKTRQRRLFTSTFNFPISVRCAFAKFRKWIEVLSFHRPRYFKPIFSSTFIDRERMAWGRTQSILKITSPLTRIKHFRQSKATSRNCMCFHISFHFLQERSKSQQYSPGRREF